MQLSPLNIAEIEFGYFYSGAILGANYFCSAPQKCLFMLRRGRSHFSLPKELQKLLTRNSATLKCESQNTKCCVPWYPPYAVKCQGTCSQWYFLRRTVFELKPINDFSVFKYQTTFKPL